MTTAPPAPAAATDEAAFIAQLRRLKTWSGRSFRQLERRADAAGDTLPYSTAATMLSKNRLPREEVLVAFVKACGLDGDDVAQWTATRATIADDPEPAPAAAPRWRRALVAAAALAVMFAGGAAFTATVGSDSTVEEETVVTTP